MLLREPGRGSVFEAARMGTGCIGPGATRDALRLLRLEARRRRDWERARLRIGAISPSDSVSVDAGEGESSSTSRSSSVHD